MNRLEAVPRPYCGLWIYRVTSGVEEPAKMSAFAPYKKIGRGSSKFADINFYYVVDKTCGPINGLTKSQTMDWSKMFFGLAGENHQRNLYNSCEFREKKSEDPTEKKEKFFIKNILKSEETTEKQMMEKRQKNFEEEASKMETIVSNLGKSDSGHRCIYCGKIYSRKYGLKIHIRTHTGYKPLKCKYCLRPFGDPSNLNKHIRLHAKGQTPYNCRFCGKVLVRRRDLERHVKSKHGEPS